MSAKTRTAFHVRSYRVIARKTARGPNHWGVQESAGYTDGRISWRLATLERFWSHESAEAWMNQRKAAANAKAI